MEVLSCYQNIRDDWFCKLFVELNASICTIFNNPSLSRSCLCRELRKVIVLIKSGFLVGLYCAYIIDASTVSGADKSV